jgi:DNA-binding transcriptional MerR regulator
MLNATLSTGTMSKLTGLSQKVLHGWATSRFLEPSLEEGAGSGNERSYSVADLAAAFAAAGGRRLGVSLGLLTKVVDVVRNAFPDIYRVTSEDDRVLLLNTDGEVVIWHNAELAGRLLKNKSSVMVAFSMGGIARAITTRQALSLLRNGNTRRGRPPKQQQSTGV